MLYYREKEIPKTKDRWEVVIMEHLANAVFAMAISCILTQRDLAVGPIDFQVLRLGGLSSVRSRMTL